MSEEQIEILAKEEKIIELKREIKKLRERIGERDELFNREHDKNTALKDRIEELEEAASLVVQIKKWCKELNVTYDRYKTALDERIENIEQAL